MPESKVTFNNGYSESINFETSQGTLPNEVCTLSTEWAWKVSKINGVQQTPSISIGSSSHSGYVILSDPVSPQSEPWVGVLDKSCQWASGATSETTCLSSMINNLYGYCWYAPSDTTHSTDTGCLNLSGLLSDFQQNIRAMDCRDYSNFINVICASQGISSQYKREASSISTYGVLMSGQSNWLQQTFDFHQISWYGSNYVVDTSLKIDNDANPAEQPPITPKIPSGDMSMSDYRSKLTSGSPDFADGYGSTTIY